MGYNFPPSPWFVAGQDHPAANNDAEIVISDADGFIVAKTFSHGGSYVLAEQFKNSATLISAAPDLLEALTLMVPEVEQYARGLLQPAFGFKPDESETLACQAYDYLMDLAKTARSAITKSTGGHHA